MKVKEFLKLADIDRQVQLICDRREDYEPPYDENKIKNCLTSFLNQMEKTTPVENTGVIVFEKQLTDWDDVPEDYIYATLYEVDDFNDTLKKDHGKYLNIEIPEDILDPDYYSGLIHELAEDLPQSYSYIFSEWNKILDWDVIDPSVNGLDLQECLSSLIREMTFNGFSEKSQIERREELEDSFKEFEEHKNLPEEEQDGYFIPAEDVFKELREKYGLKEEEETKEEKNASLCRMYAISAKNLILRHENFKVINEKTINLQNEIHSYREDI